MSSEAARDRQVAIETVRDRADCRACNPPGHTFGWTPLCEEDPAVPGLCAYHHGRCTADGSPALELSEAERAIVDRFESGKDALVEDEIALNLGIDGEEQLTDTLDALEHLTRELNVHTMGLGQHHEWEELVELLARVQLVRDALQTIESSFVTAAWQARGDRYGDVEHPTLGMVDIRRSKNRSSWDHDALAGAVLDAKLTETGGEVPDPGEVKRWLMDAAGIAYWRKGALKDLGIDVDDYCASTPGKPNVRVVRSGDTNPLLIGGGSHD